VICSSKKDESPEELSPWIAALMHQLSIISKT
jgi:hypothetical protein